MLNVDQCVAMSSFNQKEKFWHGPELNRNPVFNPQNGVGEIILDGLRSHLDQISQISDEDGTQLTYKVILERSINVTENLKGMGFRRGDVFSVISRNNEDLAPVVFGSLFFGAVLNTLDVTLDENDLLHIFDTVKPKLIFIDPVCLAKVKSCQVSLRLSSRIIVFGSDQSEYSSVRSLFTPPDIQTSGPYTLKPIKHPSTTTAIVVCTSGITGPNKMVCLSHSQVISEVLRVWDWSITSSDITFNFSSLFWVSGLGNLLIATIKGACRVITTKPYSSDTLFDFIRKYKLTHVCLPNACISDVISNKRMEETDLATLRTVIIGGSNVYDQVKEMLREKLERYGTKVVEAYGFLEIGSLLTNTRYGTKKGSCGIVATQNLVKIINKKGKSLGPGEVGEVCGKNSCNFLGYYNKEELTKETVDSNGWIRSGDLGYFDDDGFLFIKGRIMELIKCKGATISPEAIESMIQQKLGITQVCAIGIEDRSQSDDLPAVVIKLLSNHPYQEEEVTTMVHKAVSGDFALKGGVYFTDEFPMTPSGKVKRGVLKDLANDAYKEQLKKQQRNHEPAPLFFMS